MVMKVFYCDTYYRASLIAALSHLGILEDNSVSTKKVIKYSWWDQLTGLSLGQLIEIGLDKNGNRVFILSVASDKELLPRMAKTFPGKTDKKTSFILFDALPKSNLLIRWGKTLFGIRGLKLLSHLFIVHGVLEQRKLTRGKSVNLAR